MFSSKFGLIALGNAKSAETCWYAIATGVSPVNGGLPATNSYRRQPTE